MNEFFLKIKGFFLKYEHKIVLVVGFFLISAISYEFGVLQGQKWQQKPLIIEKAMESPQQGVIGQNEASDASGNIANAKSSPTPTENYKLEAKSSSCAYVGSKNSDKFYLPTCSYAKRVKPENLVCFKTAEEAIGQGRTESKCK
ncbi:MAG: hypothetical protein ACD_56C00012G0001 [uncultured bacterium]|nr:MAG: hypothetical protein ACD_56C00012G0001 [uncultured bacterium]